MRDNLNKNEQDCIAGIRHERKKAEFNSIDDIFLAGLKRMAPTHRVGLRERRATPSNPDSDPQEADPPRNGPLTGP